ncbi:MAG: cytochrome c biogenesis protein CcsA [Gaiellaceae bacterium]
MTEILFWPALVAYGEAAVAYFGSLRRPGQAGRLAIWGVRLGWLAQTALLVWQARKAGGFPWTAWAGALDLFVWLMIGAYLVWGCSSRFRLLGLAVVPPAVAVLVVVRLAGGLDLHGHAQSSTIFLVSHVGLVLAGYAGFSVAAAISLLYLFQERRLKRHDAGILRLPAPPLVVLDRVSSGVVTFSWVALTIGIGVGLGRLSERGSESLGLIVLTLASWACFGLYLLLRLRPGWRGRGSAMLAVAGGLLIPFVLLGLSLSHT